MLSLFSTVVPVMEMAIMAHVGYERHILSAEEVRQHSGGLRDSKNRNEDLSVQDEGK